MNRKDSYMYIESIGNIYVTEEIIYYDKLLTFVCKNEIGNLFLASCLDLDEIEQWLFLPLSEARLIQVLRGSITAYEAFKNAELGFLWKAELKANNYTSGTAYKVIANDKDLPDKDIVFDIYAEETFSLKNEERFKIVEQAQNERREILDISLELNDTHTHEIEAALLGKILKQTQNIVNIIAHKKGVNAKVPKIIKEENKLVYTGEYAASFGIRLKSNNLANILNESSLQENLRIFMNLLEAKDEVEKITDILKGLNPAVIQYYNDFLSVLKKENIAIKTYCAFSNEEYRAFNLSSEDIKKCLEVINADIKEIVKEDIFEGKVVAIDTTNNNFKFISEDNQTISGVINDSLSIQEYILPKSAKVKLKIKSKLNDFTGKERLEYELIELDYHVSQI